MDWFPLLNSIRIAALSTVIVFFLGIFAAYFIAKAPRVIKGLLDVILTLPLVLPPTVVGYLLLLVLGPKRILGRWLLDTFGLRVTMTWQAGVFAAVAVGQRNQRFDMRAFYIVKNTQSSKHLAQRPIRDRLGLLDDFQGYTRLFFENDYRRNIRKRIEIGVVFRYIVRETDYVLFRRRIKPFKLW